MSLSPLEHLRHIFDETAYLLNESAGLEKEKFLQDETLKRPFVRSLEIIGEATKKLPDEVRSRHSQIEWHAIAGTQHALAKRPELKPARRKRRR